MKPVRDYTFEPQADGTVLVAGGERDYLLTADAAVGTGFRCSCAAGAHRGSCKHSAEWERRRRATTGATPQSPPPHDASRSETPDDIPAQPERPTITVRPALVEVTDEALTALAASAHGIYLRGQLLVQVGPCGGDLAWLTRPRGAPVVVPLNDDALLDRLDRCATWVTPGKQPKPTTPPSWVARQIMARLVWPFPPLVGVIEAPTLRADGSLLATPGYDPESGLLYLPDGAYPNVPAEPTRDDADLAVQALLDPVCDFPFLNDAAKAGYVAAGLSLVARHAILGAVPMFAIRSPTPGTGKSLLAGVISLIGTGRAPAVMTDVAERDEMRKRLLALAIAGTPLVLLDNLTGVLGSDALASALTATEVEDRLLGRSQMVRAPLTAMWVCTGNNIAFKRTLGRRVIPIDLDAQLENPEDRQGFRYDELLARVRAQRRGLVRAALTILRGYDAAGRPRHGQARMGSFEQWDDLVRGAVVWAGLADPAAASDPNVGRGRIRAESDEDLDVLGALLAALRDAYGTATFATADVASQAANDPPLRAALEAAGAVDKGGKVTARALGYRFRAAQDRIVGGRKLVTERADRHANKRLWRVVGGDGGNGGDTSRHGDSTSGTAIIYPPENPVYKRPETSPRSPASPPEVDSDLPF